jgi:transposase
MATSKDTTSKATSRRPTDTEVARARRSWPATYKLEILAEIDAADRGEIGEIMRREGLYSSLISEWRKQRDRGALEGLRDRKPGPAGKDPVKAELARLREENAELRDHVATCEELIGAQGKAFALLQTISTASSARPSTTRPTR